MRGSAERAALVIGADGFLGSEIARALNGRGWRISTTSRRVDATTSHHLDLADLDFRVPVFNEPHQWIIIVAAMTSMQACDANPDLARRVNLEAPMALAEHAAVRGAKVLLFSTDMVVGQNVRDLDPATPRQPVGIYGAHKAELEERFLSARYPGAVCRFAKVLGAGTPLVADWGRSLSKGTPIHPFSDYYMSPISLALACETVTRILERNGAGLYQASSPQAISYADFARAFTAAAGFDPQLVVSGRFSDRFGQPPPERDRFSMSTERLQIELGLVPEDADVVAQHLGQPGGV